MTVTRNVLEHLVAHFEQPAFIESDPISIPHAFDDPRDQEVIGFYAALLAWGRRDIVLKKMADLCERMDYRPYRFVRDFHRGTRAHQLEGFKHRTFQPEDAYWLTLMLSRALAIYGTMEDLFAEHLPPDSPDVGPALEGVYHTLISRAPEAPLRVRKHIARPSSGSACKRLNMYLRWMVRSGPVDLGIWKRISPRQLLLPLDVHVERTARSWGLLRRKQNDWKAVQELTRACRAYAAEDPARYDFALFGASIYGLPEGISSPGRMA